MKYVVEVAHLVNGGPVSVHRLSGGRERRAVAIAAAVVALLNAVVMLAAAMVVHRLHRALYAPAFLGVWVVSAGAVAILAARRARRRAGRYVIGADLGADAFAPVDLDLVKRTGDRFELMVAPGMSGSVASGRSPIPVEALVADRPRAVLLDPGTTAELSLGPSTFVVRSLAVDGDDAGAAADGAATARDGVRPLLRRAVIGVELALVASVFCVIPAGEVIGDQVSRLAAARASTPWEAEKVLRAEAQAQAIGFHQCFDPLPLACQRSGYVGVGVSLNRDGELRSRWIARSTYGADCPIDECMKDVISTWSFHPLPEPMRVVLPIQVLRTTKPLPAKVAEAPGGGAERGNPAESSRGRTDGP